MNVKYILELPLSKAVDNNADIIGIKITNRGEVGELQRLLPSINKPLMIRAENDDLLLDTIEVLDRECIIGIADENNYKRLVPPVIKGGHMLIIRTPIDINLAKEMNILTSDMGLPLDKILIDTDIGGVGYGFEYGYSIMEKIKLEDDKYLNMPIISFATEETAKTKEAKDKNASLFLEITAASAVKAAGADYIVLTKPEAVKTMRNLV